MTYLYSPDASNATEATAPGGIRFDVSVFSSVNRNREPCVEKFDDVTGPTNVTDTGRSLS